MSGIINSAGSRSGVIGTTELDYEEGTYTPTLTGSTSGTWTMSTYSTLAYTKIGRTCYVNGQVSPDGGSLSGTMSVSLPFTGSNITARAYTVAGSAFIRNGGYGSVLYNMNVILGGASATTVIISYISSGSSSDNYGSPTSDNSFDMWLGFTYLTA